MPANLDPIYSDERLAELYDHFDGDRDDLDEYEQIISELGATNIADLGCGTGTLARRLAAKGLDVVGVDPAAASVAVARGKPPAGNIRWIVGEASTLAGLNLDAVVMTGNAAQGIVDDTDWADTLRALSQSIRPGGHFVFETRVPEERAWEGWTPNASRQHGQTPDGRPVEKWNEVVAVDLPMVTFVASFVFPDCVMTSTSVLRFRSKDEITNDLQRAGFHVQEVRDAPDRPGLEWIFVAERQHLR